MTQQRIILIGGGVRCGKSAFALSLARQLAPQRSFIATAQAFDSEMSERIEQHVRERGADFDTIEAPLELRAAFASVPDGSAVVVDCLTMWLSNLLLRGDAPELILREVDALAQLLLVRRVHAILVTNEVGMGLVPETPLGRAFRDLAGRAHQRLARDADEIYFALLGTLLRLRPEPVALHAAPSS